MDTINTVVTSATKAIWGEQNTINTAENETRGQEPVSGVQGKGTTEEPYDQGNADPVSLTNTSANSNLTSTTNAGSELPPATTTTTTTTNTTTPSHKPTSITPVGVQDSMNTTNTVPGGEPRPLEETEGTGVTGASFQKFAPKGSDVIPSESTHPGVLPDSGSAPLHKQQGADQPAADPADNSATILAKRDPNDHSGEPMRMHDSSQKVPDTQEERRESKVGMPGGQEHGKEQGTGEQWVKSSGLQADGGDFDATKPGAGREAERLLEEKGIHRDASGAMDNPDAASGNNSDHKVSKLDKLKDKLHIGHKDK